MVDPISGAAGAYGAKKLFGGSSKGRRRRKQANRAEQMYADLGIESSRYGNVVSMTDPEQAMGALDEFGFPTRLPGSYIAREVQFQANRKSAMRNERIAQESRDMVLGQQRFMESRRPGGAAAMMSPLVSQAAGINLQRRTTPPDLLAMVRESALHKARKAAKDAQAMQIVGGVVQAAGAVVGGAIGGPGGAVAGGAAGGAAAGAMGATAPGMVTGGPTPMGAGGPVSAPTTINDLGGGGAAPGALPAMAAPGAAGGPGAPTTVTGGPAPGGAPVPSGGGGGGTGGGGGGAPPSAGGPQAMSAMGSADAGGSMGDMVMASDPSPQGTVMGLLAELGPEASTAMSFAYDRAAENIGYDEWLHNFWQDVA